MNTSMGIGATAVSYMPGSFRITSGAMYGNELSFRFYRSGWGGGSRAGMTTYKLTKLGEALGHGVFYVGLVIDAAGVYNNVNDPSNPDLYKVSFEKFGVNAAMGYLGLFGGIPGAIICTIYFGVDLIAPGAWDKLSDDYGRLYYDHIEPAL